jgi:hypothetical protein
MKHLTCIALFVLLTIGCAPVEAHDINGNDLVDINAELESEVWQLSSGEFVMALIDLKFSNGQTAPNCSITLHLAEMSSTGEWERGSGLFFAWMNGIAWYDNDSGTKIRLSLNSVIENPEGENESIQAECSFYDNSAVMNCTIEHRNKKFKIDFHTPDEAPINNY